METTTPLLPVVHGDIRHALIADMAEEGDDIDYTIKILSDLVEKNPCIARFITQFSLQWKARENAGLDVDATTYIVQCAVMVYRLLENQASADRLLQSLSGFGEDT